MRTQPALEARQHGAAAFGSEIERKIRLSESLRPYDIAPYARTAVSVERNVYSRSKYRLRRRRSRRITTTSPGSSRAGASTPRRSSRARWRSRWPCRSWGLGSGGTRFARFPIAGRAAQRVREARGLRGGVQARRAPRRASRCIFPWDKAGNPGELRAFAQARGLFIDSMNSNTFQDQPGQPLSYKFGSLSHTDAGGAAAGDRAQPRMPRDRRGARRARAHRLDWRRRQFSRAAAFPARARSLSRQHDGDLSRAARRTGGCSSSTSSTSRRSIRRC